MTTISSAPHDAEAIVEISNPFGKKRSLTLTSCEIKDGKIVLGCLDGDSLTHTGPRQLNHSDYQRKGVAGATKSTQRAEGKDAPISDTIDLT